MTPTISPLLVPRLLWGGEESGSLYKVPFHTFGSAKRRFLRLKPYDDNHREDGFASTPSWVDVALIDNPALDFVTQNHCIVKASSPLAFIWNDPKLSFAGRSSPLKKFAAATTTRDSNTSHESELLLEDIIQIICGKRTAAFKAYIAKNGNWSVPNDSDCFSLLTAHRTFDFFVRKNDVGANTIVRGSKDDAEVATAWKDAIHILLVNVHRWKREGLVVPKQQQRKMLSSPMSSSQLNSDSHRGAIFQAAKTRDIGTLRWYFENGCPVDLMDAASGDTVLMIACRLGHLDVARLALIEHHANNDPHPDFGQTALQLAVSAGHKSIVQLILETMEPSRTDRIITNQVDENGEAPIHIATRCGSTEIMELLIMHGASLVLVDRLGKTCLHCASQFGHASCLALALDSGADEFLEVMSHDGFTPLHLAVRSNKTDCVKLLLESGADVSAETASGQSVYGLASKLRNEKILALLDEYDDLSDEDSCCDSLGKQDTGYSQSHKGVISQGWKKCAMSPTNPKYTPASFPGGLVSPETLSPPHLFLNNGVASIARRAPLHSALAFSPIVGTISAFPSDCHCRDNDSSDGGQFNYGNESWISYFTDDGYPYFYNIDRNWSTWSDPRSFPEQKAHIPRKTPQLLHKKENGTRNVSDESLRSTPIPPPNHILSPNIDRTPSSPAVPLNLFTKNAVENHASALEEPCEIVVAQEIADISSTDLGNLSSISLKPGEKSVSRPLICAPHPCDRLESDFPKSLDFCSPTISFDVSDSKASPKHSFSPGSDVIAGETSRKVLNASITSSKDSSSTVNDRNISDTKNVLLAQIQSRSARVNSVIQAPRPVTISTEGDDPKHNVPAQIQSHLMGSREFNSNGDEQQENNNSKGMLLAQIESLAKVHCASVLAEQSSVSSIREKRNDTNMAPPRHSTADSYSRDLCEPSPLTENTTEDPKLAKYFKMKGVGIPMEAILHKMKQDEIDAERVNSFQKISEVTARTANISSKLNEVAATTKSPQRQPKEQLKDILMQDETLAKFMRMASVGVPAQAVAQKMKQEGVDESKIDSFNKFHGLISSANALPQPLLKGQASADLRQEALPPAEKRSNDQLKIILMKDELLNKFMRMTSVGVPAQAVAQKMHQEGVDKSKIDLFNEFHGIPSVNNEIPSIPPQQSLEFPIKIDKLANTSKEDLAKDNSLSKYLKMKDVGVPIAAVATKMAQDGIDEEKIHMFNAVFGAKTTSSLSFKLSPKKLSPKQPILRERRRASKALQKIHWTTVAEEKLQNSLWASESVEIDDSDILRFESLFSASPTEKGGAGQKATARKNSLVEKKSSVIDPKRANNIAIALAQFRAFPTFDDLCQAVASLDRSNLNIEHLTNLQLLLPTPEELNILKDFDGQSDSLGRAEIFFLSVMKIPRFSQKLAAFKYSLQFDEQVHSLKSSLQLLAKACTEVVESQKLAGILRRLLAIGNLMNESCGKPHARGITLDSLMKTAMKKGSDGKTMVIDLLVATAMSNKLDIVNFWSDMPTVRDAVRFDLDDFRSMLRELQNGSQSVGRTVESEKTQVPSQVGYSSERFLTNLIPFLERAKDELNEIKTLFSSVEEKVQLLCCFFAEESKTCKASTIFGVLIDFSRLIGKSKERHIRKEKQLQKREPGTFT